MDPRIEEKIAFFDPFKVHRYEDKGDELDAEEAHYRQKSRAFRSVTRAASTTIATAAPIFPSRRRGRASVPSPRLTASDPIIGRSDPEVEIIAVTPRNLNPVAGGSNLLSSASIGSETIIPETVITSNKRSFRQKKHPLLRTRNSSPTTDSSPCVKMGKRKKEAPLKMAPETQQIFRGLSFYYLPNDDINPARKLRITKARQHGAT